VDYLRACQELVEEIEQREDLRLLDAQIGRPVDESTLEQATGIAGGRAV
jgi:hypothetical protein